MGPKYRRGDVIETEHVFFMVVSSFRSSGGEWMYGLVQLPIPTFHREGAIDEARARKLHPAGADR